MKKEEIDKIIAESVNYEDLLPNEFTIEEIRTAIKLAYKSGKNDKTN